ncbi:MAG: nucleoside-diphosphate kinase [Planctomycetes bacterium]|nr:nucleoside-diphosphate kinase [Planctomycetota bacterium]
MDKTLVILKPDAVARGLMGKIIARFEDKGLKIVAMKMKMIAADVAEKHYAEHQAKPFFKDLTSFITSGPVVIMAVEGLDAVAVVRKMVGATQGRAAEPGSIRGDFGMSGSFNMIHASDSPESATRELALFFTADEFVPSPDQASLRWNYDYAGGKPF